jgi:hypothetical protein
MRRAKLDVFLPLFASFWREAEKFPSTFTTCAQPGGSSIEFHSSEFPDIGGRDPEFVHNPEKSKLSVFF